jgi:hypothetical protein
MPKDGWKMSDDLTELALVVVGLVAASIVVGELGFYESIGLTPREALGWMLLPITQYPAIVAVLVFLVACAYLAGRVWDTR